MKKEESNLGYLLNKATKMLKNNFNDMLKAYELTSSQLAVLRDVYNQELDDQDQTDVSPAAVAQRLYMDRPTLSGIVERLSKNNWLTARTNVRDRRSQILSLTDKSRELIKDLDRLADDVVDQAIEGFSLLEVDQLKAFLNRIIKNLMQKGNYNE